MEIAANTLFYGVSRDIRFESEGFKGFGSQIKIIQLVNNFQREYIFFFLNIHLESFNINNFYIALVRLNNDVFQRVLG